MLLDTNDLIDGTYSRLPSNALGRGRVIPGYHDNPNARHIAFLDGGGDGRTYRVGQTYEAQELESEVMLLAG